MTYLLIDKYTKVANKVATEYIKVLNPEAVVIGGSLARGLTDRISDIEMYVYYKGRLPSTKQINEILHNLNATLTRSKNVHWYNPAWGYHTFFAVDNVKIELGYRNVDKFYKRIERFKSKLILPRHGVHDTPFGHYESGVAKCIVDCIPLYDKNGHIKQFKERLKDYPTCLKKETLNFYFEDAKTLTEIKLTGAFRRNDTYNFNAVAARVIRALVICLFTLNKVYYPGDKWNERFLEEFEKIPPRFSTLIKLVFSTPDIGIKNKKKKLKAIKELIEHLEPLVVKELRE